MKSPLGAWLWRPLLLLLIFPAVSGCGPAPPTFGEVEGTVRINGKPQAQIYVEFLPDTEKGNKLGLRSSAVTDNEGKYRLRCDNEKTGAVVGWHRVVLTDLQARQVSQEQLSAPRVPARIPDKFTAGTTTPLRVEVKPGNQVIDLP